MLRKSRGSLDLMVECDSHLNQVDAKASDVGDRIAVGLKIVIESSSPKTTVVIKSSLRSPRPNLVPDESPLPELAFLRSCSLCKKTLSPEMDVYMYRGDQGFCSVECRCRRIFLDERRERCAAVMDGTSPPCGAVRKKIWTSRRRRIPAAA